MPLPKMIESSLSFKPQMINIGEMYVPITSILNEWKKLLPILGEGKNRYKP